jgi:hypothetical protein
MTTTLIELLAKAPPEMVRYVSTLTDEEQRWLDGMVRYYGLDTYVMRWQSGGLQMEIDYCRNLFGDFLAPLGTAMAISGCRRHRAAACGDWLTTGNAG